MGDRDAADVSAEHGLSFQPSASMMPLPVHPASQRYLAAALVATSVRPFAKSPTISEAGRECNLGSRGRFSTSPQRI
jgi:hypothetical protein